MKHWDETDFKQWLYDLKEEDSHLHECTQCRAELDRLRSRRWQFWRKRPAQQDEENILRLAAAAGPNAEDLIFATEIGDRLQSALDKLSLRQRAVFALRHYEDRSLADIAGILDLDVGTVKVHLFRAIEKLREELHDLYFRDRGKQ